MKNSVLFGFITGICVLVYLNSSKSHDSKTTLEAPIEVSKDFQEAAGEATLNESMVEGSEATSFAPASGEAAPYSPELSQEIGKVKRALPTLGDLQDLPSDEAHSTPARIIEAGAALGELEEFLERRPEEFPSASRFFSECAAGSELPPSVRAMCLHSLRNNPTQWAPGVSAKIEALPSEVVDLEAQL